jgi:hypothetical protein
MDLDFPSLLGIIFVAVVAYLLLKPRKRVNADTVIEVPYKVETPAVTEVVAPADEPAKKPRKPRAPKVSEAAKVADATVKKPRAKKPKA